MNTPHLNVFRACSETLSRRKQIKFIASYFETTDSHAEWLLDAYQRYVDQCHSDASTSNLANRLASFVTEETQHTVSASL